MITVIPHLPGKALGEAYNYAMESVNDDWILFIDRDVLILNPNWYDLSIEAIKEHGKEAGWITCLTNRIGCHWQRPETYGLIVDKTNDDIKYHMRIAKECESKFEDSKYHYPTYAPLSGHFILTNKEAWKSAQGFALGWGCDNAYDKDLRGAGYKLVVMKQLYVYHMYTIKGEWNKI
jgi:glycosyltransferase involved in cell wall biosynthesis